MKILTAAGLAVLIHMIFESFAIQQRGYSTFGDEEMIAIAVFVLALHFLSKKRIPRKSGSSPKVNKKNISPILYRKGR